MKENRERYIVENEDYFKYYNKSVLSMRFPKRIWLISSYINLDSIWRSQAPIVEYIDLNCLYRCLNSPTSLTSILRDKENSYVFLSEEDIRVCKTSDALTKLKQYYSQNLSEQLTRLTFSDVNLRIKSPGYSSGLRIIDAVNCSDNDRKKDVTPAFQVICPVFRNDKDRHDDFVKGAIDVMHGVGYNFVSMRRCMPKTQPACGDIVLLFMTFEAVYGDQVDKLGDNLFHITSMANFASVKKRGLLPKCSVNTGFMHPKRVYLFSNAAPQNMLIFMKERFGKSSDANLIMLRINREKLMSSSEFKSGEMPFYVDPMFDESFGKTAVFTDSPIPVKFINDTAIMFRHAGKQFVKCGTIKLSDVKA